MIAETRGKPREADFFKVCGECHHYGCCTGTRPPLTKKRMRIINSYLAKKHIHVDNTFEQEAYAYPKEKSDGQCVFFDIDTKKCRIHTVKPETCVAGPITFDINKTTQKIEWFLKKDTICTLAGELYKKPDVYKKHMISAKRELGRLIRELDAEALRAVLAIEEPETFKVGEDGAPKSVLRKLRANSGLVLRISRQQLKHLEKEARNIDPIEACALLFGTIEPREASVKKVVVTQNVLRSTIRFEIDTKAFFEAFTEADRDGMVFLGFFHSHPTEAKPSSVDLHFMRLWGDAIWLILSSGERRFAAFQMKNGKSQALILRVEGKINE